MKSAEPLALEEIGVRASYYLDPGVRADRGLPAP